MLWSQEYRHRLFQQRQHFYYDFPGRYTGMQIESNKQWLLLRHHSDILNLLQPLNLHVEIHNPMITLRATSSLEHHRAAGSTETRNVAQFLPYLAVALLCVSPEESFPLPMPNDEACGRVFVRRCPAILDIDSGKSMVARMITVECLIVVQQITLGDLGGHISRLSIEANTWI